MISFNQSFLEVPGAWGTSSPRRWEGLLSQAGGDSIDTFL